MSWHVGAALIFALHGNNADPSPIIGFFSRKEKIFRSGIRPRFGAASARWDYTAGHAPETAEELLLSVERTYSVPSGYDRVTLWVYGDGQRETLALTTDAGETNAAVIDFTGWQQLTFTLPDKAASITGFALRLPSALALRQALCISAALTCNLCRTAAPG